MNKKQLWLRISAYHFNHLVPPDLWDIIQAKFTGPNASTKAFAHKLGVKLNWTNAFALKAVLEYKKFVYLGIVSDFVVTPSEIIDQVWHQHLLFSAAYRSFCNEVIECNFDHAPELIALDAQTSTYMAQYDDTLLLYKNEFGFDAPLEIWGNPKFDYEIIKSANIKSSIKKNNKKALIKNNYDDSSYLCSSFDTNGEGFDTNFYDSGAGSFEGFGGGDFSGGGADGSWSAETSTYGDAVSASDGSDSSSSDSGSSCSSCSSGCSGD